jgi:hypothetical protein
MTPESNTIYPMLLFLALVALQHWLNRRHRVSRTFREGAAVALNSSRILKVVPVRELVTVRCAVAARAPRGTNPPIPIRLGIRVLPNRNRPIPESRFE